MLNRTLLSKVNQQNSPITVYPNGNTNNTEISLLFQLKCWIYPFVEIDSVTLVVVRERWEQIEIKKTLHSQCTPHIPHSPRRSREAR